jgi:amino acid efflux transporter
MALIFWSYMGWEAVTHLSEEFKNPKDFPLSILLSLVLIGAIYLLVSYVVVGMHAYGEGLEGLASLIVVAERTFGSYGKFLIAVLGSMTCFASANIYIASSSRLLYALSRRGYLPSKFSKLNEKHVPHVSLISVSICVAVTLMLMLFYGEIVEELVLLSNTVFIVIYIIGSLSGIFLLDKKLYSAVSLICRDNLIAIIAIAVAYTILRSSFLIVGAGNRFFG